MIGLVENNNKKCQWRRNNLMSVAMQAVVPAIEGMDLIRVLPATALYL